MTQHGVGFVQGYGAGAQLPGIGAGGLGDVLEFLFLVRQEFVQRRVQQADGDGQARHFLEDGFEIAALHGQQFGKRRFAFGFCVGQDHLAHGDDALGVEEHVFGTAQADAFSPELARRGGIGGCVGIGAHFQDAHFVGPAHQRAEIAGQFGLTHADLSLEHLAGGAIDGDDVAAVDGYISCHHFAARGVNLEHAGARYAGPAHAARHHSGVAGHAAAGGEDAACRMHAVNVFRAGFGAHQNHIFVIGGQLFGFFGCEGDLAGGGTGRRAQAGGDLLARGIGIQRGMQQLVQGFGFDTRDGGLLVDQSLAHHVHGCLQRRIGRALAGTGLQHEQLAFLDGELHVLHVSVMLFQPLADGFEFLECLGHGFFHAGLAAALALAHDLADGLRGADAGHHVFALGVDQEFAVEQLFAGSRVAGKGDAGGAAFAAIAEHHGLHGDGRAPVFGDVVQLAIGVGARAAP